MASITGTTTPNWRSRSRRRCAASRGGRASARCCSIRPDGAGGGGRELRGQLLQLVMLTFKQELGETRKRIAPLLPALRGAGPVDEG